MATVLEPSTASEPRPQAPADRDSEHRPYLFTGDQALKMVEAGIIPEDKSTELLDGVLYKVTKGELHNAIVGEIAEKLRPLCPADHHVREEKSNRAGDWSLPEPDVALCRGSRFEYLPHVAPLEKCTLVVEVSQNSEQSDRVRKFAIYAAAGVSYYWIVDVDRRCVEVWTGPARSADGTGTYESLTTYKPGQAIPVVIDGEPRGEIQVADIFPPERPE